MNQVEMIEQIIRDFKGQKDEVKAPLMEKYLKNQFKLLGVQRPGREIIQKKYYGAIKALEVDALIDLIYELWGLEEREFHYFAIDIFDREVKRLPPRAIELALVMLKSHQWWDTVDILATKCVGELFLRYPELIISHLPLLEDAEDFWLRRVSILFQLKYKNRTDTVLLTRIIEKNLDAKEFFIRKSIGWILREYSKTNPGWVRTFVQGHPLLSALSVKEASKYL